MVIVACDKDFRKCLLLCYTVKSSIHTQAGVAYLHTHRKQQALTITLRILEHALVVGGIRPVLLPEDETT